MDREQAEKAIKTAWGAGIVSGVLTLIVTVIAMAGYSLLGFSSWNLLDVAVIGGLSFGIYRKSRTCAVIMFVYFIGSKIMLWVDSGSLTGLPMALVFGWFFYQGMLGAFAWHSLNPEAGAPAPRTAPPSGPVPKFKTREEYQAWKAQRIQQPPGMTPQPYSSSASASPAESSGMGAWIVAAVIVAGMVAFFMTGTGKSLLTRTGTPVVWQEFSSTEGNFAVMLPGTPAYEKKATPTNLGPIDMHIFSLESKQESAYIVMYSDYPEVIAKAPPDSVLDGGRNGALANTKGKLIGEQSLSLDGFPGREFTIEIPGKGLMKARTFLVRQRLIQVLAVGTKERIEHEDTGKFLTSLRLLTR